MARRLTPPIAVGPVRTIKWDADGLPRVADDSETGPMGEPEPPVEADTNNRLIDAERLVDGSDQMIHWIEAAAAFVFAALFGIGLFDLVVLIAEAVRDGNISDPAQVVTFVDRGLLLFIIAEVYQTVVAYVRRQPPRTILRLVIFTGIIAIVRKVIVFRTEVYETKMEALTVAGSYTLLLVGLAVLLTVEQFGASRFVGSEE